MNDATVLALNTGRSALLAELLQTIEQRSTHPGQISHWLITGPRGAGKSYFLRLLQATLKQAPLPKVQFILLPEELPNIFAPHELLAEISRLLDPAAQHAGTASRWRVDNTGQLWDEALAQLLCRIKVPLLVVGIENFDGLIAQAFSSDVDNSRLRHLMSNEPHLMFVASAVQGDFDEQHNQRLFRQFEHRSLPRWTPIDHRHYLDKRAKQQGSTATTQQFNRIDAYSRYTGGNARAAAVLAATILDVNDPLDGADDLDAAIEKMSDYYRALIARIPDNTKKLFDALVRGGEPASQTELAERTGARQNDISRAFAWLVDNGYVNESREPGQKTKHYRVQDRLLVQFYRMRYLHPGQRSRLAVMADLLADTLSFSEKWQFARRYAGQGLEPEAQTLVELALQERQIDATLLPPEFGAIQRLISDHDLWLQHDNIVATVSGQSMGKVLHKLMEAIFKHYPTDDSFKAAIEHVATLARASHCGDVLGSDLVPLVEQNWIFCPAEIYLHFCSMSGVNRDSSKWQLFKQALEKTMQLDADALSPTRAAAIEQHRLQMKAFMDAPLTASLHELSLRRLKGSKHIDIPLFKAADWAARAAVGWQAVGEDELQAQAIKTFFRSFIKSHQMEYVPEQHLAALDQLRPIELKLDIWDKVRLLECRAITLGNLGQTADAYQALESARSEWLAMTPTTDYSEELLAHAALILGKMASCQGGMNHPDQALGLHQQAITEIPSGAYLDDLAWNLGQIARYRLAETDASAVWLELDTALAQVPGYETKAIQHLGDAVADAAKHDSPAKAFAAGLDILQGLAERPHLPTEAALRGLWIGMIEMAVPWGVLRDLLGEWPQLWPVAEHSQVHQLKEILLAWLAKLEAVQTGDTRYQAPDDPDLVTTLTALEQALSPKTRHRLGLLKPAAPEKT
ncbi:MAG: hypothetical protein PHQ58_23485 [Rhodoferax sp.]|uniref:hypothetical protein n=1 Tax=Rhodoferax sp. TaxID=50421 RepID=UPI002614EE13|nr:hypothetical protein [Rhodoferax sp.]MDD2883383.1 hypothetical protein [Rhodoferax sp.]